MGSEHEINGYGSEDETLPRRGIVIEPLRFIGDKLGSIFDHPPLREKLGSIPGKEISRRELLAISWKAAVGVVILSQIPGTDININSLVPILPRPDNLPGDTLTENELTQAGITIYQTPETELYLRREVLDMPIFKDAKEGSIGGVVITLVDAEAINWDSVSRLEKEPRQVWEATELHPREYSEEYWQEFEKYYQFMKKYSEDGKKFWEGDLEEVVSGGKEKMYRKSLERAQDHLKELQQDLEVNTLEGYRKMLRTKYGYSDESIEYDLQKLVRFYNSRDSNVDSVEEALTKREEELKKWLDDQIEQVQRYERDLQGLVSGAYEKKIKSYIENNQRNLADSESWLETLPDRQKAIEKAIKTGGSQGRMLRPGEMIKSIGPSDPRFSRAYNLGHGWHPDWLRKVYLFICVSGEYRPSPISSYPSPDWFGSLSEEGWVNTADYDVYLKEEGRQPTGFMVRHEVEHHTTRNEYEADHQALYSISQAWQRYQETGDSAGYVFVFATKEGLTITKRDEQAQKGQV